MIFFLNFVFMLLSIFMILVILIQRGRGGGLAGAFGGLGGSSAFGTRAGDVFTRITVGVFVVWLFLAGTLVKMMTPEGAFQNPDADKQAELFKGPTDQPKGATDEPVGTDKGAIPGADKKKSELPDEPTPVDAAAKPKSGTEPAKSETTAKPAEPSDPKKAETKPAEPAKADAKKDAPETKKADPEKVEESAKKAP